MTTNSQIPAVEVTKQFVLSKCGFFLDVQLWPIRKKIDPAQWLTNFEDDEMNHAVHLLNAFVYFSNTLVNELFRAAFHKLSSRVVSVGESFLQSQNSWREFVDKALITNVTGETPSITDSGISFARKAKKLLDISEDQITDNRSTLIRLISSPGPVVFVDDFVGSGNQFVETWTRQHETANGTVISFEQIADVRNTVFFYTPLVSTEYGLRRINDACQRVKVLPAHVIPDNYSVFSADSLVWPEALRETAVSFIERASRRAGIPVDNGSEHWMGFHDLGLCIAFEDSVPDATLPLFSWEQNGWKPLIRIS